MSTLMRSFRFTEHDVERLEKIANKYIKMSEKEGIKGVTKNMILRVLILLGESIKEEEVIQKIKDLKLYG